MACVMEKVMAHVTCLGSGCGTMLGGMTHIMAHAATRIMYLGIDCGIMPRVVACVIDNINF